MINTPFIRRLAIFLLLSANFLIAATPPTELSAVIQKFMNMESTGMRITQTIEWKYSKKSDILIVEMDVKGDQSFHLLLDNIGTEIYVAQNRMVTVNHYREQILIEDAVPDALLNQIFVGGDLNDARYKGQKELESQRKQLNFRFYSDFSDWEALSIVLNAENSVEQLLLEDYDGNRYVIKLDYSRTYVPFEIPDADDYPNYTVADLRG